MKNSIRRIIAVVVTIFLAIIIFSFLLFIGNRSRGPLQDLFTDVNNKVAKLESGLVSQRESRSINLNWLNQYRNNKITLNKIDTILLGVYDDNTFESFENVISLEDSLKQKLSIISIYTAWGSKPNQLFPLVRAQAIYELGSIPMITWEPWLNDFDPELYPFNKTAVNKNKGGMKAIAEGKYDRYIDKWAEDAQKFGLPFFLRLGHEMNDPYRYPWGQQNNTPEDFVAAWRHIISRFDSVGMKNAIWVWSPHPTYSFMDFYPGDQYVDWIGFTALNYGTVANWSQWWSFDELIGKAYKQVSLLSKPLMLTEFGSLEVGGDRKLWYKKAFETLPSSYPQIKALVFFHAVNDATVTYKSLDWSFDEDPEVIKSINEGILSWK